ncbi:MAG: Rieske (2Fe-2S) protein [Ketobacteraceae bacterium]|nr:Rieske (2Fe-2S) protein [Ketobacteraceae bacterium]
MTVLCSTDALTENSAKGFQIGHQQLVAVKKSGEIYVYVNSCPHIGITLEFKPDEFLDLKKQFIQCANHGALFEIDTGDCISGPCIGQALKPVPVSVDNNQVKIVGDIPPPF